MGKKELYLTHLESWEPGHYSEEAKVAKDLKTDEERIEFIDLLVEKLRHTKDWKQYLIYLAGGAYAFYKNPSFAFFYCNEKIKHEFERKIKEDLIPKVTQVDQELFDVFAANIENNLMEHKKVFMPALLKCLENCSSYSELYNDYLCYYLRLYYNTLKLSDEEALKCRSVVMNKISKWGEPKEEQEIQGFHHIAETFGVCPYKVEETLEEIKTKGFLFMKKKETIKVVKKNYFSYEKILEEMKKSV